MNATTQDQPVPTPHGLLTWSRIRGHVGSLTPVWAIALAFIVGAIPIAIAGAVLFYASDGILGWNKFVEPVPHGRVAVMTTYHLGQIGLVLALAS